jgi:phosphoribosyl 1,2-cyclic phosphodiesterase
MMSARRRQVMKVTLWGTRGSLAAPGPQTARYGGNTACVEVRGSGGGLLVLDAGTGIRPLGVTVGPETSRVDVMLTHLHMDHIQGLGFFGPLYTPDLEVHVWGPPSTTLHLRERLARYLSPPLFPVRIRDLPCNLTLHDVPLGPFEIGEFTLRADLVCHPDPTVGYRISNGGAAMAYLADHEPALGARSFPEQAEWTSGFKLATGAALLIHDAQYTDSEYVEHVGWGHSSISHTLAFAEMAGVGRLVTFHHDPQHDDAMIDGLIDEVRAAGSRQFELTGGTEGASFEVA